VRIVGTRTQYRVTDRPSADALRAAGGLQEAAIALAAFPSTGVAIGVYRFRSHAEADAHAQAALARAIAARATAIAWIDSPWSARSQSGTRPNSAVRTSRADRGIE
jgi:hypothetical protein